MKEIKELFTTKVVDNKYPIVSMSYMDMKQPIVHPTEDRTYSTASSVNQIQIALKEYNSDSIVDQSNMNTGLFESMQHQLNRDLDNISELLLFEELRDTAIYKDYTTPYIYNYAPLISAILRLIKYKPKIHIHSKKFMNCVIESIYTIGEKSRMGNADFAIVSPKTKMELLRIPFVEAHIKGRQGLPFGRIKGLIPADGLSLYESNHITDGQIIIGRSSTGIDDNTLIKVETVPETITKEIANSYQNQIGIRVTKRIGIGKLPGGEYNYIKFDFSYTKHTPWTHIKERLSKIVNNFMKNK